MGFSSTSSTGQRVAADIKGRRGIGIVPAAAAPHAHIPHGERLLAVGDKAVIPRLVGRVVSMAGHLLCRQGMTGFAALTPRRITTTHSK